MMEVRCLKKEEICRELFLEFERRQVVTDCKRMVNGQWVVLADPFIDQWTEEEYQFLIACLKNTIETGGVVYGAFRGKVLKGFCSVESTLLGEKKEYLDLTSIHVSEEVRGQGIGKALFLRAADWSREHGGKKLYISAHSAVESQAFYQAMGCVEAKEYQKEHVEAEPCDCQLEYIL